MQQYSKDRQLGKKSAGAISHARQAPQGFWMDGDSDETAMKEPILEVTSSRRMPQPEQPPSPRHQKPPTPTTSEEDTTPVPTKDYPLRRLPVWVFSALHDLAQQRAKEAHLVQSSVNAEMLTALEQYVISRGYRRDT